jgi:hypothetical protein
MNAFLNKLTIVQLRKPARASVQEQRRAKLISKLEEQMALASAQAKGERYSVMKNAWVRDDTGAKSRITREKIVRPWYFADGGSLSMSVKYGSRILDLNKGKRALSIGDIGAIPSTIAILIEATKNGELDLAMEQAVSAGKNKSARS